ncbi:hypothetical protein Tco_0805323, partial [Tanacetum coccineum]
SSHPMMVFFSKPLNKTTSYPDNGLPLHRTYVCWWGVSVPLGAGTPRYTLRNDVFQSPGHEDLGCGLSRVILFKLVDCSCVMGPLSVRPSGAIPKSGHTVCGLVKILFCLDVLSAFVNGLSENENVLMVVGCDVIL